MPRLGMPRVGEAEVEEDPAVTGPGLDAWEQIKIDIRTFAYDVLTGRRLDPARWDGPQLAGLGQRIPKTAQTGGQLRLEQFGDPGADFVDFLDTERLRHAPLRAEHVDGQRHVV